MGGSRGLFVPNHACIPFKFPGIAEELEFFRDGPVFRLFVERSGTAVPAVMTAEDFDAPRVENVRDEIKYVFDGAAGLRITVTWRQHEAEVVGTIQIENSRPGSAVNRVQFPYITYPRVTVFDRLLMASSWGDDIPKPVRTIKHYCDGRDKGFWIYDYVKATADEVSYSYPSIMAMQFMVLHNPSRALYLACYGTGDDTRTFNAQLHGHDGLALSVNHYPFLATGNWTSPECAFALLPGGWRPSADIYARNMRKHFRTPKLPAWMRDERKGFHGWVQFLMRREGHPAEVTFQELPEIARCAREAGLDVIHFGGWTYDGFDTYYPDFEFDPKCGTEEELRTSLERVRAEGSRAILYTNGRLVDPRSKFYRAGGDKAVCLNADGKPYIERYNTSAEFRIACPACKSYGDQMAERIRELITRYGANGAQVDQISCNYAYFCHDKAHPHKTPANNFLPGIEYELQAMRAAHQKLDPEFFVWCEGCNERFGQFYDINQGHGEEFSWALGDGVPELYSYVYPKQVVTGLSKDLQALCYSYAQGKPFDVPLPMLDDPGYVQLLRQFTEIRKAHAAYFLNGTFIDCAGLETVGPVRAFGIERHGGNGLLVNLWKPGAETGAASTASLRIPRPNWSMQRIYPSNMEVVEKSGWIELSWAGAVASVSFESEELKAQ